MTQSIDNQKKNNAHTRMINRKRKNSPHPLRSIRIKRGFTLHQLSELTNLSPSYLSRIENGGRRLNTDIIKPLARILACHPGDLLLLEESNENSGYGVLDSLQDDTPSPLKPIKDLPVYAVKYDDQGHLILKMDEQSPLMYVARPIELQGLNTAFAFMLDQSIDQPYYRHNEWVFVHPHRAFMPNCHIIIVTHDNHIHIGQFKQGINGEENLELAIITNQNGQNHIKQIHFDRSAIKFAYCIIGSMTAMGAEDNVI